MTHQPPNTNTESSNPATQRALHASIEGAVRPVPLAAQLHDLGFATVARQGRTITVRILDGRREPLTILEYDRLETLVGTLAEQAIRATPPATPPDDPASTASRA